jgi:tetratricopeptide (TPR) repeat protein
MKRYSASQSASMARTLFSQGLAFHQEGNLPEARASYRRILKLIPNQPDALHMLGVAEFQEKNFGEAIRLISQATKLKNDSHLMHFNLGNALRAAGQLEDASNAFRAALALSPDDLEALKNLGNTYKERNMMAEAISCYDQLLEANPGHAPTLYNKGIALLTLGELNDGWDLYEQRLRCDTTGGNRLNQPLPRFAPDWDGSPLDKPLLVLPEQGLGDQIFYGSMLADLQAAGVESFVCLDERLQSLFARSFPGLVFILPAELTSLDPSKQLFGAQIQLASLGRIFRRSTADFSRIPSPYLAANNELISTLRKQQHQDAKFICGLSWTSANAETGSIKSIKLDDLHPLLKVDGTKFINLQYGDTVRERRSVLEKIGVDISQVESINNQNDIDELAALISACDIVISVSNSTAHLAAAVGKPTILLLAQNTPLWYWHLGSRTSPWYPTVTLLRQDIAGDWTKPIQDATDLLTECAAAMKTPSDQ